MGFAHLDRTALLAPLSTGYEVCNFILLDIIFSLRMSVPAKYIKGITTVIIVIGIGYIVRYAYHIMCQRVGL